MGNKGASLTPLDPNISIAARQNGDKLAPKFINVSQHLSYDRFIFSSVLEYRFSFKL